MAVRLPKLDAAATSTVTVGQPGAEFKLFVRRFSLRDRSQFESLVQGRWSESEVESARANAELKQMLVGQVIGWEDVLTESGEPLAFSQELLNSWLIADRDLFWDVANALERHFTARPSTAEVKEDREAKKAD